MEEDIVKNSRVFRRFLSPYTDTEIQERKIPTERMVLGVHRGRQSTIPFSGFFVPSKCIVCPKMGRRLFLKEFGSLVKSIEIGTDEEFGKE